MVSQVLLVLVFFLVVLGDRVVERARFFLVFRNVFSALFIQGPDVVESLLVFVLVFGHRLDALLSFLVFVFGLSQCFIMLLDLVVIGFDFFLDQTLLYRPFHQLLLSIVSASLQSVPLALRNRELISYFLQFLFVFICEL